METVQPTCDAQPRHSPASTSVGFRISLPAHVKHGLAALQSQNHGSDANGPAESENAMQALLQRCQKSLRQIKAPCPVTWRHASCSVRGAASQGEPRAHAIVVLKPQTMLPDTSTSASVRRTASSKGHTRQLRPADDAEKTHRKRWPAMQHACSTAAHVAQHEQASALNRDYGTRNP